MGCGGRTSVVVSCVDSPLPGLRTFPCTITARVRHACGTRSGHTASSPCPGGSGHGPSLPRCQVGLSERAWDPHQGGAGLVSNRCPKSHKLFPVTGSIPSLLGLQTVLAILHIGLAHALDPAVWLTATKYYTVRVKMWLPDPPSPFPKPLPTFLSSSPAATLSFIPT